MAPEYRCSLVLLGLLSVVLLCLCVPCYADDLMNLSPELREMIRKAQEDAKKPPQTEAEIIAKLTQEANMRNRDGKGPVNPPTITRIKPGGQTANRPPPKIPNGADANTAPPSTTDTGTGTGTGAAAGAGAGAARSTINKPTRPRPVDPAASLEEDENVQAAKAEAIRRREASRATGAGAGAGGGARVIRDNAPPPPRPGSETVEERRRLLEERKMRRDSNTKGSVRGGQYSVKKDGL